MSAPLLALHGIHQRFGRVVALRGADFAVAGGEFHALLGENGAGKSTLMHVASGLLAPDAGTVELAGRVRRFGSPRDAYRAGIGMVHQHPTAIPALTVAENVALAAGWPVAPAALRLRVQALTTRLGLPLDPEARAERLTVALKQRLEIVQALAGDARILLLDEPTAVLAPTEAEELMARVRRFTHEGGAAVLITHKLDEALRWTDRVTVLRRGAVVLAAATESVDAPTLVRAMVGEGDAPGAPDAPALAALGAADLVTQSASPPVVSAAATAKPVPAPPVRLRCAALEVQRDGGLGIAVRQASLVVRAGELVGIAAVEGNGQRELLRAVAGLLPAFRGRLEVAAPVAFVPEDRTLEGLIGAFTLTENVVLGVGRAAPWVRGHRLHWAEARARTAALLIAFGVRAPGPEARASSLSGGNQQKVVIARALERHPQVLVAENPTRGLDVRAAAAVHERLHEAARAGAAVLVYSSDLDEIVALAPRLCVMRDGRLHELPAGADRAAVGDAMLREVAA